MVDPRGSLPSRVRAAHERGPLERLGVEGVLAQLADRLEVHPVARSGDHVRDAPARADRPLDDDALDRFTMPTLLEPVPIDGTAYSDLRWSALAGWLETRRGFVLRTGEAGELFPVPLRAFGDAEGQHRFRELLVRRLGPEHGK